MTLDGFFTLTETSNGLTSPSRVRELMAVMQNEKDSHAENFSDSTRQWCSVASSIAATDKKDCLDLFIRLDGLHFLHNWLKDAINNLSNTSVEDSITLLLQALEKLPIDYDKLVASGIFTTVENLLVHNSSKVQNKAQEIYQSWKINSDGDVENILASNDHEVGRTESIGRGSENSDKDASLSKEESVQVNGRESTSDDLVVATSCEAAQSISKSLDPPGVDDTPLNAESCSQAVLESNCDIIKHTTNIENSAEKENSLEETKTLQEKPVAACSDAADAMKSENGQPFSSNLDRNSWDKGSLYINSSATDTEGKSAMNCNGYVDQSRDSNALSPKTEGDFKHPILRRSSSTEKGLKNNYNFAKNETVIKNSSDIELDCGIIDPLEVARQVAMEVEREVDDYKEQSCSSSEKVQIGNAQQPHSPDIMNRKESFASEGSAKDMEEGSPMEEDSATSSETLDAEQTNLIPDMKSSQVTETAQAEVNNPEKEIGNFDLNQEICSEDTDHQSNQFPTPVSIVSASKAQAALEQPAVPLKFEGNLGWKGSASTSAFRPASPRRTLESEKDLSSGCSSKQRQMFLDIDLNVAESVDGESCLATNSRKYEHLELDLNHTSEDDGPSEWRIGQLFPQGNGHQSRSHSSLSSVNQPSFRNFDLNGQPSFFNDSSYLSKLSQSHNVSGGLKSDDSVISIMGTRVQVNRNNSASRTQPLLNSQTPELAFDLNLGRSGNNFLGIGSVVPYTHTPVYGYNNIGHGSGPRPRPGPVMPFSPTLYGSGGPIPYMVDSRGAPVIPQLMGSVSALPTSFAQPPFVMNMNSSIPSYGVGPSGPSRSSFDLNSGMMEESGSGEPVGFRQFLSFGPMGEQMSPNAQSSMSLVGGKRKEPENEWENYPFRHYTPPWK